MKAMKDTDRGLIRDYLLGRLDEQTELEGNLSSDILFNQETAEVVDSVEDEIIEAYLDGSLDPMDRAAVDGYFLRSAERKEKLRFAQVLRRHLETSPRTDPDIKLENFVPAPASWYSNLKRYGQLATLLAVCVASSIYIAGLRKTDARLQAELAQERERSPLPTQQLAQLQAPVVPLTLVMDRSRGTETRVPRVKINPSTQRLMVEIALPSAGPGPYEVKLESKASEGPLWSAKLLPLISKGGDGRLVFDVPTDVIKSDVYSFAVSSSSSGNGSARHTIFRSSK